MIVLNTSEYETCKRNLLQVANIVSPTGKEQQSFTELLHKMKAAGESYEIIISQLCHSIEDGILYGDWPKP